MDTNGKNRKKGKDSISHEEWEVRYDILHNLLWIIVKATFLLGIVWYVMFLGLGYGSWLGNLGRTILSPVALTLGTLLFEKCFGQHKWPLDDYIVLVVLDLAVTLVLAEDWWTHSMHSVYMLPVIFGLIFHRKRLVYFQACFSFLIAAVHVFVIAVLELPVIDYLPLTVTGIVYDIIVISMAVLQICKYTQMLGIQITIDSLTRLHNHEAFYEELDAKIADRAVDQPLCVLIADIDNFKKVNDTYGHAYGDKVLKALAVIFLDAEDETCFAARYGGEEFALIMDMGLDAALVRAENMRMRFAHSKIPTDSGQENSFTISIGVASYVPDYKTSSQFFEKADEALYKAKANGKNQVCKYQ